MLSPRRTAATAAFLGALIVIALVVLVLGGLLPPGAAAATAAFAVALAALALLLLTVRRVDGKAQRIDQRVKKHEAQLAKTATALQRIDAKLGGLAAAIERADVRRDDDLAAILASLGEDRVNAAVRARELDELREEVRALAEGRV